MTTGKPGSERRPDREALGIAVALAAIALMMAVSTYRAGGVMAYTPVGPKTFPYIIAAGLFILSIFTAIGAWRGEFPEREERNLPPILWVIGGLVVQLMTMKTIGFSIATGLLFAATAKAFGRGPLWMTVPIGIVFSFIVWFIFAKGLQLSLPAGPLEQFF